MRASEKSQELGGAPWVRLNLARWGKEKPLQVRHRAVREGSGDAEDHRSGTGEKPQPKGYLYIYINKK